MNHNRTLTILIYILAILAAAATLTGILSDGGDGEYLYESVRGEWVTLYGKGIYRHMSAGVAIQGIAQDYVTLFIAVPMLLLSFRQNARGSISWRIVLLGTLGYLFVTYLFYLVMAMYNALFLVYSALCGISFFGLMMVALSFNRNGLLAVLNRIRYAVFGAWFLIINSLTIAMLWLSMVLPPLADGSIYPKALEHYTTLIVQGIDLALLLPLSFISGSLLLKKIPLGYLMTPAYLVFLSLLMTALVAKLVYLGIKGYSVMPAIYIIPLLTLVSITGSILFLIDIKKDHTHLE